MKFNEKKLKNLLQNEVTEWDSSDLSWFDEDLFIKFENKQLNQVEHEDLIEMMAHDQAVLNHYLHLKQQKKKRATPGFLTRHHWVLASFLLIAVGSLVWVTSIEDQESGIDDISRGASETMVYPKNNAEMNFFPSYFVGPEFQQQMRVELLLDKDILWQSEWQKSQKFMLPLSITDQQTSGKYLWRVVSENNDELYASSFTLVN